MQLSKRISTITEDGLDGWEHYRRARALKDSGVPVIELTLGEHDIRTAPEILDELRAAAGRGNTGYAPIPGSDALRRAIADRVERTTGVPTGPENVVVMPGGQMALFCAHHAACDPGDRALFIDPYYATYPGTIRAVGAVPVSVRARADHGFQPHEADLDAAAADGGARSLLINSPNNPTAAIYTRATLEGIGRVCAAHDMWLISDEVYDSQVWDGAHLSPRAVSGLTERTLVVGSLSKSHAMTGSRIGWIVGPAEAIGPLCDLATSTNYGLPGYIQDAGLYALNLGPDFEVGIAAPFRRRREIARDLLARQNVVKAAPMQGAMYAMLDIRATGLSGIDFASALLDAERIAVMPGESFGAAAAGHVRVALTVADDVFAEAFGRVLDFAAAHA